MTHRKTRLAVFCSGGGSNFQALYRAIEEKQLSAEIVLCLSNRSRCGAMEFAREHEIKDVHLSEKQFPSFEAFTEAMLETLRQNGIDIILLAGYMRKVPDVVVGAFPERILNIHPALLPKFGGDGMYGLNVHAAVIASGETISGATVHLVNEEYDKGRVLMQQTVPVMPDDTAEVLAERVLACEHQLYAEALEKLLGEQNA
ncbi:MAG: phosphoribosylglycinamide formyltransferase [Chlorobiaceae bacterium]|jgi:phosphoribosylglycinamide formyltransferase 1|nr:phosphoribosylglycinamide formyltransferase [Chlorobiaceae bacterium]NTW63620.1 phosphoribosylglycinamide formyltransferase [Chlorobiaceae bacterium]